MRAQGLPVNIIVLTALGLIVLVVVAAFFITGMSGAAQQTGVVEADQAYCNGLCGQMVVAANNANTINDLANTQIAQSYQESGCARKFGCCQVTLRTGEQVCAEGNCDPTNSNACADDCVMHTTSDLIPGAPSILYFVPQTSYCYPAKYFCNPSNERCEIEFYYDSPTYSYNTICQSVNKNPAGGMSTCTQPVNSYTSTYCSSVYSLCMCYK